MSTLRRSLIFAAFSIALATSAWTPVARAQSAEELLRQIQALEARIAQLEEREALTVTAPFTVKAPDGRVLLVVDEDDESAVLRLHDATGRPAVEASASGEGEGQLLVGWEERLAAAVSAGAEGGSFEVLFNGNEIAKLDGEEGTGSIELRDSVESVGVRLEAETGGSGSIELLKDGEQVALRLESGDETALRINDDSGEAAVEAAVAADGGSHVRVGSRGEFSAAMSAASDGQGKFDVLLGGKALATLSGVGDTGTVMLRDSGESVGAWLAALPGGSGFLNLFHAGGEQFAARLRSDDGGGRLELYDASGAVNVEASVTPAGEGAVIVSKRGEMAASVSVSEAGRGTFDVISGGKRLATLNGEDGGGRLELFDGSGAFGVEASVTPAGEGALIVAKQGEIAASVSVSDSGRGTFDVISGGNRLATLNGEDGAGKLELFDGSGAFGVEASVTPAGEGALIVAKQGEIAASVSVTDTGRGTFDVISGGNRLATMNGEDGRGRIVLLDSSGTVAARLEALPGGNGSLDLHASERLAAQIGPGSSGLTALRIFNGEAQVAAIGRSPNDAGGALRIFGGNGAPKVSLDSFAYGGGVNVYGNQALPVAAVTADSEDSDGVVAVYNAGTPVAFLTRSSAGDGGNVTVALNDGFGVFSAGAAQDGAGEACVQRRTQAGTERVACVGLGLPSAGMGK